MAQISRPQKRNELGEILPIAGAVAGGMISGGSGALQGASAGQMAASVLGGGQQQQTEVSGAAQRRMQPAQTMPMQQVDDPIQTVEKARVAVANLPPDQQQLFAPALNTGYAALRRQQNGVS